MLVFERLSERRGKELQFSKQGADRRAVISTAWIFVTLNYLYADVLVLLGDIGPATAEEAELVDALSSPDMLLVAAIYLELAMVMSVLSRLLRHGVNRWANMVVATFQAAGATASLFVVTNEKFYIFFVAVEIAALLFIVWCAWSWVEPQKA